MHTSRDGSGVCDGRLCTACFVCERCSFRRVPLGVEATRKNHVPHVYEELNDGSPEPDAEKPAGARTRKRPQAAHK